MSPNSPTDLIMSPVSSSLRQLTMRLPLRRRAGNRGGGSSAVAAAASAVPVVDVAQVSTKSQVHTEALSNAHDVEIHHPNFNLERM